MGWQFRRLIHLRIWILGFENSELNNPQLLSNTEGLYDNLGVETRTATCFFWLHGNWPKE